MANEIPREQLRQWFEQVDALLAQEQIEGVCLMFSQINSTWTYMQFGFKSPSEFVGILEAVKHDKLTNSSVAVAPASPDVRKKMQ